MYSMELTKKRGVSEAMFQLNEEQQRLVKKNLALPKVCEGHTPYGYI